MSSRLDIGKESKRVRPTRQLHLTKCSMGKVRYRDKREALDVLHSLQVIAIRQKRDFGMTQRHECRVYECDSCHGYHATSRPLFPPSPIAAA